VIKGREESDPAHSKAGMPTDTERNVSDPSSTAGESDLPGEAAAPPAEDEHGDSTAAETGEEENKDEVVDTDLAPDEMDEDDEAANEPPRSESKSRSRRHGPLSP